MGLFSGCLGHEDVSSDVRRRPARRINKNIIGQPTNFQHTAHFGAEQWTQDSGAAVSSNPNRLKETLSQVQTQVMAKDPLRYSLTSDNKYNSIPLHVN
ncbi:hypothetical protein H4219_001627 [Mycoemilia scoparia]|uniref:CRIB domain-containing protein n=1 Tax=Mycoemilia scoparia TaxID=417184 RepID=A0A9W8DVH1_9FUNG|nr:hypothetical protein H4219_001627 [Mycoemilia scoparia]